jgi:toxin ParE1/3/4
LRRCEFTRRAEADLTEIALFIAKDSPARALTFVAELRARCLQIARHPDIFRLREEYGQRVRVAVEGRYLIFFSIQGNAVLVEHIRHGHRNLEGLQF